MKALSRKNRQVRSDMSGGGSGDVGVNWSAIGRRAQEEQALRFQQQSALNAAAVAMRNDRTLRSGSAADYLSPAASSLWNGQNTPGARSFMQRQDDVDREMFTRQHAAEGGGDVLPQRPPDYAKRIKQQQSSPAVPPVATVPSVVPASSLTEPDNPSIAAFKSPLQPRPNSDPVRSAIGETVIPIGHQGDVDRIPVSTVSTPSDTISSSGKTVNPSLYFKMIQQNKLKAISFRSRTEAEQAEHDYNMSVASRLAPYDAQVSAWRQQQQQDARDLEAGNVSNMRVWKAMGEKGERITDANDESYTGLVDSLGKMRDRMTRMYGKDSSQASQYQRQLDLVNSAMNGGDGLTKRQMWALGNTLAKRGKTYDQIELENARLGGVKDGDSGLLQVNGNTGVQTYRGVQYTQLPDGSWGITGMAPHDKSGKLLPDPRDQETYHVAQNGRAFAKDQNGNWVMLDSKQDQLNKMTKDFSERGASKEQLQRFTNDPTTRSLLTHYDDLSPATRKSLSDVRDAARNAKRIPSLLENRSANTSLRSRVSSGKHR